MGTFKKWNKIQWLKNDNLYILIMRGSLISAPYLGYLVKS